MPLFKNKKVRAFVFTVMNWTEKDKKEVLALKCRYLIFGEEKAPINGTPHLQGYIYYKNPMSFRGQKNAVKRWHVEIAKGKPYQCRAYCIKDNTNIVEIGKCPIAGKRTDLIYLRDELFENKPLYEVARQCVNYQQLKYVENMSKYVPTPVIFKKKYVQWYWGDTGTGKTRAAVDFFKGDCYISNKNLQWWEGYYGQKNVIIDDFRGDFCTFHELLRILDGYNYRVEVKGASVPLLAENIIITCPFPPEHSFVTIENYDQLLRRISEIKHFSSSKIGT